MDSPSLDALLELRVIEIYYPLEYSRDIVLGAKALVSNNGVAVSEIVEYSSSTTTTPSC